MATSCEIYLYLSLPFGVCFLFYFDAVHTSLGINLYLFREHNNPESISRGLGMEQQNNAPLASMNQKTQNPKNPSGDVCIS